MTPNEVLQIGERLGVPAAIILVCLFFSFLVLKAAIGGCRWTGERLFGKSGIISRWFEKQIELIDGLKEGQVRVADAHEQNAAAITSLQACVESFRLTESSYQSTKTAKLDAIHDDVKLVKTHTEVIKNRILPMGS